MNDFMNGLIVALHVVAGVMFLRFWVDTRDRLFVLFAAAFLMLAGSRIVLFILLHTMVSPSEHTTAVYIARLLAYLLILWAIIDKSRRSRNMPARRGMSERDVRI